MYNYDKDDNIIRVSDSKGITADFTYDKAGNIVKCVRSDGTETTYSYDKKYNLTSLTNRKGDHIISSYSYEYDKEDRVVKETERKDEKVIVTSFTYDKAGQLTGYIKNEDGKLKKTSYTYNAAGNRVSITRGGDEGTIKVTYNRDNQVVSEENSKTGDKIKYVYDENGNLIEKKSRGSTVVYEYDIENRLRSVSQGGQMLMAATYDGLGNKVFQMSRKFVERDIEKEDEESGDDDEDGEISGEWFDPDMFMYGFMQGGMKMSTSQSPSLMAAAGNKLSEIWEGIRTFFTGDFETTDITELAGIIVPGTERGTFITYDLTYYLNDTNFNEYSQVMYQYGEGGDDKASYVYGAYDERISADLTNAAVAYVNDRAGSYTYLYDGQGNVTQNVREGKEANSYYYDPFGKVEDGVEDNDIIFGYNGEEYTEAAQLQYLRQRHYAPDMGAFTSQDAYRGDLYEPVTQNRYTYAVNDPVNYNDPGGDRASRRSISNALNDLASAASRAATLTSLSVAAEAVNKVGWTTQYKVNNPSASDRDVDAAYNVYKGLKATVQANETLMQAVKNLQTGVECAKEYIEYKADQFIGNAKDRRDQAFEDGGFSNWLDYLTFGLSGNLQDQLEYNKLNWEKLEKEFNLYNLGNYLSSGMLEIGKTYFTTDPGSIEWFDSYLTIGGIIFGVKIAKGSKGSGKGSNELKGGSKTYAVDPSMQTKDIEMGVLVDGAYIKNPTAQNMSDLIKPGSNYIGNSKMNGQFMYVVDTNGNIVIGTRAGQHMPHPTLIGGTNPIVQGAGIVDIRGGKIYSIDNSSGHYKPDSSSMDSVQNAFGQLPSNIFHKDFQGYSVFDE